MEVYFYNVPNKEWLKINSGLQTSFIGLVDFIPTIDDVLFFHKELLPGELPPLLLVQKVVSSVINLSCISSQVNEFVLSFD
jgi:hypothetical protein